MRYRAIVAAKQQNSSTSPWANGIYLFDFDRDFLWFYVGDDREASIYLRRSSDPHSVGWHVIVTIHVQVAGMRLVEAWYVVVEIAVSH